MESKREARRNIRRLLWRWGKVDETCMKLTQDIEDKRNEIQAVTDIKSPIITDMPHGTGISDRTAKAAEKLERLEQLYNEFIEYVTQKIDDELRFQLAMNEAIHSLPAKQVWVIELRYKSEYSYERIARKTHYSVENVKVLDAKACDRLMTLITIEKDYTFLH